MKIREIIEKITKVEIFAMGNLIGLKNQAQNVVVKLERNPPMIK